MSVGNRLRDRQAETGPLYFRRGGAKEAIEDPWQRLGGDAAAGIDDLDQPQPVLRSHRYLYDAVWHAVSNGIVDEIGKQARKVEL